jgi:hypothetical protein
MVVVRMTETMGRGATRRDNMADCAAKGRVGGQKTKVAGKTEAARTLTRSDYSSTGKVECVQSVAAAGNNPGKSATLRATKQRGFIQMLRKSLNLR